MVGVVGRWDLSGDGVYPLHDVVAFIAWASEFAAVSERLPQREQKHRPQSGASKRRFVSTRSNITMYYLYLKHVTVCRKGSWSVPKKHPSDVRYLPGVFISHRSHVTYRYSMTVG